MSIKTYLATAISCLMLIGCGPRIKTPTVNTAPSNVSTNLTVYTENQKKDLTVIDTKAKEIVKHNNNITITTNDNDKILSEFRSILPATSEDSILKLNALQKNNSVIQSNSSAIKEKAEEILQKNKELQKQSDQLQNIVGDVKTYENKIKELESSNKTLQQDGIKKLYSYLSAFFAIGLIIILAGAVLAYLYDKKMGITISLIGLLSVGIAAAATFYLKWIAVVGMGIILAALAISAFLLIRSLLKERTATKENVQLIQEIKTRYLDENTKKEIFGTPEEPKVPLALKLQSKSTQNIVKSVKPVIKKIDNTDNK